MRRKVLAIVPTWLAFAIIVCIIYHTRELEPVSEFTTWALSVWPILTAIGALPLAVTAWIIKHDFSSPPSPIVFIRSTGKIRLSKDLTQQYQRRVFWYEVAISNPSPKRSLGVQKVVLTWGKARDERQIAALTPIVGHTDVREDEREQPIEGEIGSSFNLEPNEVKAGKLVFVAEENRYMAPGQWDTEILKLTDSRGNTVTYATKVNDILS